jgi:hypothetical protein
MPEPYAVRRPAPGTGAIAAALLWLVAGPGALAYGTAGHVIAGELAEQWLCERARTEIGRLGDGQDLGELGLWADRIRSDPDHVASAPWHYINIADGEALAGVRHPPEGDLLWAIDRYSGRLRDSSLDRIERAEALKFLIHFIVDLHQPLHVGLADDRGGNAIILRFRGETTNLHRLWDTHAIDWTDQSIRTYRRRLSQDFGAADAPVSLDPLVWAEESLALRRAVYDFGGANRQPRDAYLDFAAATTRERLALSARRLAGTLNSIFCR